MPTTVSIVRSQSQKNYSRNPLGDVFESLVIKSNDATLRHVPKMNSVRLIRISGVCSCKLWSVTFQVDYALKKLIFRSSCSLEGKSIYIRYKPELEERKL